MADPILKAVYDNQDDVPQQYAELFEERGGKYCFKRIEGLATQADVERLSRAVKQERDAHGATKQALLLVCGDQKPEEVRSILDRVPELEASAKAGAKPDDKKIEDIVHARVQQRVAPLEREVNNLKQQVAERDQKLQVFAHEKAVRTIHDGVRAVVRGGPEGKGPKIVDSAEEEILLFAERHFEITDDGRLQTREGANVPAGLDAAGWFNEMANKKPHWFGPTQGSGALGGKGFGSFANNPFTHENWNMTEQGRLVSTDRAKAEQMAKAAGTTIGGKRPAPRK